MIYDLALAMDIALAETESALGDSPERRCELCGAPLEEPRCTDCGAQRYRPPRRTPGRYRFDPIDVAMERDAARREREDHPW